MGQSLRKAKRVPKLHKKTKCHLCPRIFDDEKVKVCECGARGPGDPVFEKLAPPTYITGSYI